MELLSLRKNIDAVKEQIDKIRPLPTDLEKKIMDKFRLDWNYHSSSIEGNSLTFGETKIFLLHGLTASGKPLKDHIEIKGHNEAVFELLDIIKGDASLREITIRNLHELVLKEPTTITAETPDGRPTSRTITPGQYKQLPNHVRTATGEIFRFAEPGLETSIQMRELVDWYNREEATGELHPLDLAALLHYRFIRIHPFDDGNGRIARLLMNLVLMRHAYPPVVIRVQDKENYYRALRLADGDDLEAFISYIGEQLLYSVEVYLRGAKGESIDEMDDMDKRIELFKAQLVKNSDTTVKAKYSPQSVAAILRYSIGPSLQPLASKLSRFDDLFYEASQELVINQNIYRASIEEFSQAFDQIRPEPGDDYSLAFTLYDSNTGLHEIDLTKIYRFEFNYTWRGFRHSSAPFNCRAGIECVFQEFQYIVVAGSTKVSKLYHQHLTEDECRQIANQLAEQTLNFIEEKTKTDTSS